MPPIMAKPAAKRSSTTTKFRFAVDPHVWNCRYHEKRRVRRIQGGVTYKFGLTFLTNRISIIRHGNLARFLYPPELMSTAWFLLGAYHSIPFILPPVPWKFEPNRGGDPMKR